MAPSLSQGMNTSSGASPASFVISSGGYAQDFHITLNQESYLKQDSGNMALLRNDGDKATFIVAWNPILTGYGAGTFGTLMSIGLSGTNTFLDMGVVGITSSRRMFVKSNYATDTYADLQISQSFEMPWAHDKWYHLIYDFKREDIGNGTDKIWVRFYARKVQEGDGPTGGTQHALLTQAAHLPASEGGDGSDYQLSHTVDVSDAANQLSVGRAPYDLGSEPASSIWATGGLDELRVYSDRFDVTEKENWTRSKTSSAAMDASLIASYSFDSPSTARNDVGGGVELTRTRSGTNGIIWDPQGYREFVGA